MKFIAKHRLLVVMLAAVRMLPPASAAAKKPHHAPAAPAYVTASYDAAANIVTLAGCNYDFQIVAVVFVPPDGSILPGSSTVVVADGTAVTCFVGMWSTGCMDSNYYILP